MWFVLRNRERGLCMEDFLEIFFKIERAYRKFFHAEMQKYCFTPNELLVILYLHRNNDVINTAKDIARYEGVSKGLIARSVESLTERGYLRLERDSADKRMVRLYLTEECGETVREVAEKQEQFFRRLCAGVDGEQIRITMETIRHFKKNLSDL